MKKLLILLFLSQTFFAQKTVKKDPAATYIGELSYMGNFIADIKYTIAGKDTNYVFEFHNDDTRSTAKTVIVHFTGQSALEQLYTNLMNVFSDKNRLNPKYSSNIILGETVLIVANSRAMAVAYAYISTEQGHLSLSEKQVKTLFSRK
jgi:hypothetical protein